MSRSAPSRTVALTRPVSETLGLCELTHVERVRVDVERARAQHAAYTDALRETGCRVVVLPAAPDLPDAVFVEDTCVVLDEAAFVTRPGAASRRAEVETVAEELARHRPIRRMPAPATLDGGDVLRVGRTLYVGVSGRTNAAGAGWLREAAAPFGYAVVAVRPTGCLHLKTAATVIAPDLLLVNPEWVDTAQFGDVRCIDISPDEPFAANALLIGDRVIHPEAFAKTARILRRAGVDVISVDVTELAKAEGGVTCCSILLEPERDPV